MRFRWDALALIWLLGLAAGAGHAQTQLDLRRQSRNVDFTGASFTRPAKTGTAFPPNCTLGDVFFKTDALAGNNLYVCTGAGVWNQATGGSAPPASQLLDFQVTFIGGTATVNCITCNYRVGDKVFLLSGNKSATNLTGNGGSGTVFFYLDPIGAVRFGFDGTVVTGATLSGLVGQSGVTGFQPDSIPLASCSVSGNAFTSCTDYRAIYNQTVALAGDGMLIVQNPSSGKTTYSVNPAVVGILGGPNTWTGNNDFSGATHTTPAKIGSFASIPASCAVGELYFATDKPAGQNLFGCASANNWTIEGDGVGSSAISEDAGYFSWFPFPMIGALQASTPAFPSANGHRTFEFMLPYAITVNKLGFVVNTASGICGSECGLRMVVWNSAGTTKLIDTGVMTSGGTQDINSTGFKKITLASPVTLQPGAYYFSWSTNSTVVQLLGIGSAGGSGPGWFNTGWAFGQMGMSALRVGAATNTSGSGASLNFGSTRGTVTADNTLSYVLPWFILWRE